MKHTSFSILGGLGLLVLFGVGCSQPAAPVAPLVPPSNPPVVQPVVTPTVVPTTPSNTTTTAALPAIDDTWKTYANKALGFSFQYPTKGRYSPLWEVTFVGENDSKIQDGCLIYGGKHVDSYTTPGGTAFCHKYQDLQGDTDVDLRAEDYYSTRIGKQYIVITFTKDYKATVKPVFNIDAYRAQLDQIVSTFAYEK